MSVLTRILSSEKIRKKSNPSGPGTKTPLAMRMDPHPDLEDIMVSNSKGELVCVHNKGTGVMSNFFTLDVEEEDPFGLLMIEDVFEASVKGSWGNSASVAEVSRGDIDDVIAYFSTHGLGLFQILCGYEGYCALWKSGILVHPSGKGGIKDLPEEARLREWESEYFVVSVLEGRPVYYHEDLGPYVVFAAHPSFVGAFTRVHSYVCILIHNPDRGVVILKTLNDNDAYADDESHEESSLPGTNS
jgi:hypothetical protein